MLKLVPRPREVAVALCAVASPEAALTLFTRFQAHDPASVQAFEFMSGVGVGFVLKHIPGATLPLAEPGEYYVLVELATPRPDAGLRAMLETVLEQALTDALVLDAAIAESEAQRAAIWRLREEHSEAQKREGASVKNDVSVPVSKVPEFIRRATAACEALIPGIRAAPFGHLGDGNIHFNVQQPQGADPAWFLAQDHAIMETVNEVVRAFDGSFSAEHGIGRLKPYMMPDWRGGAELAVMRRIKDALDPLGIMNPGQGPALNAGAFPAGHAGLSTPPLRRDIARRQVVGQFGRHGPPHVMAGLVPAIRRGTMLVGVAGTDPRDRPGDGHDDRGMVSAKLTRYPPPSSRDSVGSPARVRRHPGDRSGPCDKATRSRARA